MENCLFCKIIKGDIPASKVYEDEYVYAFHDIDPQAPVHILILPKEHIPSAGEITRKNSYYTAHIFEAAAQIAKEQGFSDSFRIVSNCGDSAGQSVKHLHFHLLSGRDFTWPPG